MQLIWRVTSRVRFRQTALFALGCVVFLILFLYYFSPSFSSRFMSPIRRGSLSACQKEGLKSFQDKLLKFDAISFTSNEPMKTFPMIGNGLFGCSLSGDQSLLLHGKRSLNWAVPQVKPLFQIHRDAPSSETTVVDFLEGMVHKIQCIELGTRCLSSTTSMYAHRSRPNLLVQQVRLHNPTDLDTTVELRPSQNPTQWTGAVMHTRMVASRKTTTSSAAVVEYSFTRGQLTVTEGSSTTSMWLLVAQPVLRPGSTSSVTIQKGQEIQLQFISGIAISPNSSNFTSMENDLERELTEAMTIPATQLAEEHSSVWKKLWKCGVYLDTSLANGEVNGADVNATMYLVLSHVTAPIHITNINLHEHNMHMTALTQKERCYQGHDTLSVKELWRPVMNLSAANELVSQWMLTFEKQGCEHLVKAGADGVVQALVLSLGSLEFNGGHLEFEMHTSQLWRDITFRGLKLDAGMEVELHVHLDDDLRPVMRVRVSSDPQKHMEVYVCEAACSSGPILVPPEGVTLPMLVTEPPTPLLYVSHHAKHLREFSHVIHVRKVHPVAAFDAHQVELRRHGGSHVWSGIPRIYWVLILLVVGIFHAVIGVLLFQEYCGRGANTVSSLPPVAPRVAHYHQAMWARSTGSLHQHHYHHPKAGSDNWLY